MTGRKTEIQRLERYGNPAIFFHWVLALLITIMIALGWYMMSVEEEPGSDWLFKLHISIGITAAALIPEASPVRSRCVLPVELPTGRRRTFLRLYRKASKTSWLTQFVKKSWADFQSAQTSEFR